MPTKIILIVKELIFLGLNMFWSFSELISGAPNDSFLSDPLKRYFRLSGVP